MFHLLWLLTTVTHPAPKIQTVSGLQDEVRLTAVAHQYGIPPIVFWTIAYKESGVYLRNRIRGPGQIVNGHRICREYGRMQINPCIGTRWAPNHWAWLSKFCRFPLYRNSYNANIRCGAAIIRYRWHKYHDFKLVIEHWNGAGPKARKYKKDALSVIGEFTLRLLQHYKQNSPEWNLVMGDFPVQLAQR